MLCCIWVRSVYTDSSAGDCDCDRGNNALYASVIVHGQGNARLQPKNNENSRLKLKLHQNGFVVYCCTTIHNYMRGRAQRVASAT